VNPARVAMCNLIWHPVAASQLRQQQSASECLVSKWRQAVANNKTPITDQNHQPAWAPPVMGSKWPVPAIRTAPDKKRRSQIKSQILSTFNSQYFLGKSSHSNTKKPLINK